MPRSTTPQGGETPAIRQAISDTAKAASPGIPSTYTVGELVDTVNRKLALPAHLKPLVTVLNERTEKHGRRAHASRCLPQARNPPSYARSASAAIFRVRKPVRKTPATKDVTPDKSQDPPSESSGTLRCSLPCLNPPEARHQYRC